MTILRGREIAAPWTGFREMEDRLNRIFNGPASCSENTCGTWMPAVDLHESEDSWLLEADLPGMKKDDIEVTVHDGVVTLKGNRKYETEEKKKGYHRVERRYGEFQRSFRIPHGVDNSKVEAKFEDGVLKVTLPKPEQARPKQIEVKVN